MFPSVSILASLKDLRKNIASVLDFMFSFPTCICMPKCSNHFMRMGVIILSLLRSSVLNTMLLTKENTVEFKGDAFRCS